MGKAPTREGALLPNPAALRFSGNFPQATCERALSGTQPL